MTEGCMRLRLHKASSSLHRRDQWGSVGRDTHLLPRRKHLSHVRSRGTVQVHTLSHPALVGSCLLGALGRGVGLGGRARGTAPLAQELSLREAKGKSVYFK